MRASFVSVWLGLLLLATPASAQQVGPASAQEMLGLCQPALTALPGADGVPKVPNTFNTGFCIGAFTGLLATMAIRVREVPILGVCPPKNATSAQIASLFAGRLRNHPEDAFKPWLVVALDAARQTFPCQ